ncbi:beta-ketoacyl-ACP synthase III [Gulosibacter molinativorax]|uniref:Beta-ketoacyl-[acyl-carrier-protein] synthase III n=1 Tax=Gulosibacter molinativorax TaxID=256821 RepID=A0ABT7C3A3_9MICO|nr:beta-ketoacyl-ACP synthase III [Gulosibacter molinativorax]MDJ1369773.1 ketoacyl-ACP synthase III [Gulosibacter molinativorax]QUY61738.1 3-oxoacyl-[acyl-carrier-protein] synthase 3 [Gulosibacter molinativorax]
MSETAVLRQAEGTKFTRIYGYGAFRGQNLVTNDELAGPIDSSDEWIRQRTGIITRARADQDTNVIDMGIAAGKEAIEASGIEPSQIGAVLVATITNVVQTPAAATRISDGIGAGHVPAYDLSAGCAGYCYAITQADALIRAGVAEYVLVIGTEKLSDVVDPTDRSISFLLGDGAGAAVVGPADEPGISESVIGSDGSKWDAVAMNHELQEFRRGEVEWPTLRQDGRAVFRWAVWEMAKAAREVLDKAGIKASDLAAFIPHQANMRIIDEFANQLELPESVVIARDIADTGNTSSASIPLATHRLLKEHPELSGGLALQIGFGAGLAYAAQVVRLP